MTVAGEPDPGLARAAADGIHRIALPTPFPVGPVNCYLVEDDPLTLVDPGPNAGTALDRLEEALAARGHRLEDVGLVVVTHHHIDHIGLAGLIARRSGASVAALDRALPYLRDYDSEMAADAEFARQALLAHGVPPDVVAALHAAARAMRGWGAGAPVDRVLAPGDRLDLRDRAWEVHWRPGHSIGDMLLEDRARSHAFAGDHLLANVATKPLLARPRPDGAERPAMVARYLESLAATRALDVETWLPGHGATISDHRVLIDNRLALHRRRAAKLHRLIAERPRTAYELAQALWGNIAASQALLTVGEVVGHVDLLLADGSVRALARDGEPIRFKAIAAPSAPAQ